MTSLLHTTRQTELEPLTASGLPVYQMFPQLRAELRSRLGTEHANMFAEPNPDPATGSIQWYSPVDGVARQLTDLTGADAEQARQRLLELSTDIERHIEGLEASSSPQDAQLAKVLRDALEIPSEANVVFIGEQPVLTGWGHVQRGGAARRQVLRALLRRIAGGEPTIAPAPAAQPPPRAAAPPQPAVVVPVAVAVAATPWGWLSGVLWGLFAALLLFIGYLALEHCAIGIPGSSAPSWLNFCEGARVAALNPNREQQLEDKLAFLRKQLDDKRRACRQAAVPPPKAQPKDEQLKRLEQFRGRIGKVNLVLQWETHDDLDLIITCPNGDKISYTQKKACGGELDVDKNAGSTVLNPVENVYFEENAPPGSYKVRVNRYAARPPRSEPTPFKVTLRVDGEVVEERSGAAGDAEMLTFELPYRRGGAQSAPAPKRQP